MPAAADLQAAARPARPTWPVAAPDRRATAASRQPLAAPPVPTPHLPRPPCAGDCSAIRQAARRLNSEAASYRPPRNYGAAPPGDQAPNYSSGRRLHRGRHLQLPTGAPAPPGGSSAKEQFGQCSKRAPPDPRGRPTPPSGECSNCCQLIAATAGTKPNRPPCNCLSKQRRQKSGGGQEIP